MIYMYFDWTMDVNKKFKAAKERFTQHQLLHPFDPKKCTRLVTDAARL